MLEHTCNNNSIFNENVFACTVKLRFWTYEVLHSHRRFARVEIHLPDVGPGKQDINISLESRAIRWI